MNWGSLKGWWQVERHGGGSDAGLLARCSVHKFWRSVIEQRIVTRLLTRHSVCGEGWGLLSLPEFVVKSGMFVGEVSWPTIDEDLFDAGAVFEDITIGEDKIGNLADLD